MPQEHGPSDSNSLQFVQTCFMVQYVFNFHKCSLCPWKDSLVYSYWIYIIFIYAHWMEILSCAVQIVFILSIFFGLFDIKSPNKKVNLPIDSCGSVHLSYMAHML